MMVMNYHKNFGEDPWRHSCARGEKARTPDEMCMPLKAFFAPSPFKGLEKNG